MTQGLVLLVSQLKYAVLQVRWVYSGLWPRQFHTKAGRLVSLLPSRTAQGMYMENVDPTTGAADE